MIASQETVPFFVVPKLSISIPFFHDNSAGLTFKEAQAFENLAPSI